MKKLASISILVVLTIGVLGVSRLFSQSSADEEKMMQMMMKYGTPGEFHKKLDGMTGSWNFVSRWWADPSAPPQESKGTCEAQWILGGRFVQENVTGDMQGQPFQGMGLTGYDNYNEKYKMLWVDEMATCFMLADGHIDGAGKVITFTGKYDDYMTGQKDKLFKAVVRMVDANKRIFESYDTTPDGKEFLSFEVTYTKAM